MRRLRKRNSTSRADSRPPAVDSLAIADESAGTTHGGESGNEDETPAKAITEVPEHETTSGSKCTRLRKSRTQECPANGSNDGKNTLWKTNAAITL